MTARRFKGLSSKWNALVSELLDRFVEVFYLKRGACSLISRLPLLAHIRNRERVITNGVLDPFSAHHFI